MLLDPKTRYSRVAGAGIAIVAAIVQALLIGAFWWRDPNSASCDDLPWGDHIYCLARTHTYIQAGVVAVTGWCLATIGFLLGRFVTPYISGIVPGGVLASSMWVLVKFWPPSPMTTHNIVSAAGAIVAMASFYSGPVAGAWLAGYGARKRRRLRSNDLKAAAQAFD